MNNKEIVKKFNKEVIEQTNYETFKTLMHPEFINHTAPPTANGAEGMWYTFHTILKPAFPDLVVEIEDQIEENDKVVTRKIIRGTHLGKLFDFEPTGKSIKINIIDIVRIKDGQYFEHWGINTLQSLLSELKQGK
ncbi:ester cyclase [Flavobacterium cerinum]|uniref:Ester cyclase n=1 Tax=Flavobacterium cerinum TaxID=2502784 RepID=A0ABY5IPV4_9FLAO|nr:ester cyclase [Flavobacterium cerinum]UUC44830.1 ester cyclase [Flavobacterium cerinum]